MHARHAYGSQSTPMGSFGTTGQAVRSSGGGINLVPFPVMGMTLRLSEQQAEALRRQAAVEGRSMQVVALSAVDEYIARRAHKAKVAAALQRVVREEAGVLERLKDA
jgi:hypothetical protein